MSMVSILSETHSINSRGYSDRTNKKAIPKVKNRPNNLTLCTVIQNPQTEEEIRAAQPSRLCCFSYGTKDDTNLENNLVTMGPKLDSRRCNTVALKAKKHIEQHFLLYNQSALISEFQKARKELIENIQSLVEDMLEDPMLHTKSKVFETKDEYLLLITVLSSHLQKYSDLVQKVLQKVKNTIKSMSLADEKTELQQAIELKENAIKGITSIESEYNFLENQFEAKLNLVTSDSPQKDKNFIDIEQLISNMNSELATINRKDLERMEIMKMDLEEFNHKVSFAKLQEIKCTAQEQLKRYISELRIIIIKNFNYYMTKKIKIISLSKSTNEHVPT